MLLIVAASLPTAPAADRLRVTVPHALTVPMTGWFAGGVTAARKPRDIGPDDAGASAGLPAGAQAPTGPVPVDVAIDPDEAVTITWADGHRTRLALDRLRRACPCAHCNDLRRAGGPAWSGDASALRVRGAELVGNWGLGLAWSDGHATGVHAWSMLRASCRCPRCRR